MGYFCVLIVIKSYGVVGFVSITFVTVEESIAYLELTTFVAVCRLVLP